jgi:hypothetical protein
LLVDVVLPERRRRKLAELNLFRTVEKMHRGG